MKKFCLLLFLLLSSCIKTDPKSGSDLEVININNKDLCCVVDYGGYSEYTLYCNDNITITNAVNFIRIKKKCLDKYKLRDIWNK